jgi:hypothetical protein
MTRTVRVRIITLLMIAAFCGNAPADDLINPTFDSDLSGWTILFERPAIWDPLDVDGSASSGSALLTHVGTSGGGALSILGQCVPLSEGVSYDFGAWVIVPAGNPASTTPFVIVNTFDNDSCSGSTPVNSYWSDSGPPWDDFSYWRTTTGQFTATAADQTAFVHLSIFKQSGEAADASAHFDNVWIDPPPDEIFNDRFEVQ